MPDKYFKLGDVIVPIDDINSPIPSNGVVISIHLGNPFYDKLHESVKIGDTVTIAVDNIKPYSAGKIISVGGNNSQIPDGEFIASSHGAKSKWLQNYARLGSRVILNKEKMEVRIVFTPDSYVDMAMFSIKAAQDGLDLTKAQYMDIDYEEMSKITDSVKSKD